MDARRLWPLEEAFVWPLMFFETCDDDTLDADICVQQMEDISAALNTLDPTDCPLIVQTLQAIAQDVQQPDLRDRLLEIPPSPGWLGDPTQDDELTPASTEEPAL